MTIPQISHGTFRIDKTYNAPAEDVFAAWADLESRAQWFVGPGDWKEVKREMDFRVGGKEVLHSRFGSGYEPIYEARFHRIVPDRQIVFVYDMHLNGKHHSLSLATIEIESLEKNQSRLVFTEQVAFLDGTEGRKGTKDREDGTAELLKLLANFLEKGPR